MIPRDPAAGGVAVARPPWPEFRCPICHWEPVIPGDTSCAVCEGRLLRVWAPQVKLDREIREAAARGVFLCPECSA